MIHNFGINRISPSHTHTHCTALWIVFSWWIVISSGWYRERVGPVVISSLLCLYQVYVASPLSAAGLLRALPLIQPSSWLYILPSTSQHRKVNPSNSRKCLNLEVIQVSFHACGVKKEVLGNCGFMILMMLREGLVPPGNTPLRQSKLQTIIPQWQHSGGAHKAFGYLSTIKLTLKGDSRRNGRF